MISLKWYYCLNEIILSAQYWQFILGNVWNFFVFFKCVHLVYFLISKDRIRLIQVSIVCFQNMNTIIWVNGTWNVYTRLRQKNANKKTEKNISNVQKMVPGSSWTDAHSVISSYNERKFMFTHVGLFAFFKNHFNWNLIWFFELFCVFRQIWCWFRFVCSKGHSFMLIVAFSLTKWLN